MFFERQRQIRPVARNCTVVHSDSSDFYNKTYIRVELTCFYFAVFVCAQIHFANAYVFPYNYIVLKLDVFLIKPNLNFNVTFPNYCNNTNIRSSICLIIRKKKQTFVSFRSFFTPFSFIKGHFSLHANRTDLSPGFVRSKHVQSCSTETKKLHFILSRSISSLFVGRAKLSYARDPIIR